ncbi:MAG TPA: YggT family protein [Actinobacteria bacterium]|nr:YggT family protein [Actinomycetota bacterium]
MSIVFEVIALALLVFWLFLLARLVFDLVQAFSRGWQPRGPLLIVLEFIYSVTDPPLRLLRRFIPPLRIGQVSFDLAFLILLLGTNILISVVRGIGASFA